MRKFSWVAIALMGAVVGCAGASPPSGPAATGSQTGSAPKPNPFGIPSSVTLPMPTSLTQAAALTQASPYRTQSENALPIAAIIHGQIAVYTGTTTFINTILNHVEKAKLEPDRPLTFDDPDRPGKRLTVLLQVFSDHALISIGEGEEATGSHQILGISYSSRTKGRAVFRSAEPRPKVGKFAIATTYDLDAGKVSADGLSDPTVVDATASEKAHAHWEFASLEGTPSFEVKASVFRKLTGNVPESGNYALVARFLPDGSAAAIVGAQTPSTGNAFVTIPPGEFYMSAAGTDLATDSASASLKAVLPTQAMIYQPFPGDPDVGDPFLDARFRLPE